MGLSHRADVRELSSRPTSTSWHVQDDDVSELIRRGEVANYRRIAAGSDRDILDVAAVDNVAEFLRSRAQRAIAAGIDPGAIVIDPGIGFGKSFEHNLTLLRNIPVFTTLGFPVLVGVSRKAFIGKILNAPPEDRLEGSLAAAAVAIVGGAHMIRVHDVGPTARFMRVMEAIRGLPETDQENHV